MNKKPAHDVCMQRGNALFLILIAVVLFAGLSYAILQSTRSSGAVGRERLETEYSRYANIAGLAATEMMRLRISGCRLEEIPRMQTDPPSANGKCNFWSNQGGGFNFNEQGSDQTGEVRMDLYVGSFPDIGVQQSQEVAFMIVLEDKPGVEQLCDYINERQHIVHTIDRGGSPFASSSGNWDEAHFAVAVPPAFADAAAFSGKTMGCAFDTAYGTPTSPAGSFVVYRIVEEH